ncbi:hypothetical protein D1007_07834 [Hordeum vulgare]|nr:hypothetical protein D1007_07834 [Hordeum vulgare]
MNVKSCGAVINLRKWSESVGAKGVLNVAWVNVGNIPLDKRHERNIAYVGSLVGVTMEIDKATINRRESVRIKLGCRDAEDIPASAEGIVPSSASGKIFSSYLEACMGEPVVTEIDPNESSAQQKMQSYSVQSRDNSGEKVEVIPTPLVREEMQVRFSKRNVGANVEHVGVRAERMAQKKDPQDIISELEISRANIAKKVDKNDKQQDKMLFITNAAGEASPLDTE